MDIKHLNYNLVILFLVINILKIRGKTNLESLIKIQVKLKKAIIIWDKKFMGFNCGIFLYLYQLKYFLKYL